MAGNYLMAGNQETILPCPKCLEGKLVKPTNAVDTPYGQPDWVCDICGSPLWNWLGKGINGLRATPFRTPQGELDYHIEEIRDNR